MQFAGLSDCVVQGILDALDTSLHVQRCAGHGQQLTVHRRIAHDDGFTH